MLSPNADIKVSIFKYSKVNIMKLDIIASISHSNLFVSSEWKILNCTLDWKHLKNLLFFACYSYIICVVSDGFRVEQATGSKKDLFAHSPGNLSQIFLSQVKC